MAEARNDKQMTIYKTVEGEVVFDVDREEETIWATGCLGWIGR